MFCLSCDGDVYVRLGRLAKEYTEASETIKEIRSTSNEVDSDDEIAGEDLVILTWGWGRE